MKPLLQLAQSSANRQVRFVGLYAQIHRPYMIADAKAQLGSTYVATGKPGQALELFIGANTLYDLHKLKRPVWLYSRWTETLEKLGRRGEVGAVLALHQEAVRKNLIQY